MTLSLLLDLVILMTAVEAVALAAYRRATGRGVALRDIAPTLGAGLCLMLALRSAVAGQPMAATWAWLLAAGVAHGIDLRRRWARPTAAR
jgi:hypothetical protein